MFFEQLRLFFNCLTKKTVLKLFLNYFEILFTFLNFLSLNVSTIEFFGARLNI